MTDREDIGYLNQELDYYNNQDKIQEVDQEHDESRVHTTEPDKDDLILEKYYSANQKNKKEKEEEQKQETVVNKDEEGKDWEIDGEY